MSDEEIKHYCEVNVRESYFLIALMSVFMGLGIYISVKVFGLLKKN